MIGLVAVGLGILAWAFTELQGRYGPSYGTRLSDGKLVLASHGYLHVFQSERRIARLSFKELGLGETVADLDAGADGTLLAADSDTKSLKLCRLEQRRCTVFYDGRATPDGEPRKAFKAAVEPGMGRVVLSDSSNHRLLLLDGQGRLRQATPKNGPRFTFPNGITFLGEGLLAVADTDHSRIAFLRLLENGFATEETELRMRSVFPGSDLLFPIDLVAEPGGRLWAILANNALQTGTVVAMQADGSRQRHIALHSPADPLSLVALDDAVLVLEPTPYRVSRIAVADGAISEFGDRDFVEELRREGSWRSRLLVARQGAQALLVLALIGAVVIAVRSRTMRVFPQLRPKWQIPAEPAPLGAGTHWIEANPLPGGAMMIGYAAIAVIGFGAFYVWLRSVVKAQPGDLLRLELMLAFFILVAVLALVVVLRRSRGRIGIDGQALFVDDAGRKFDSPLADVLYSNTRLLVGHRIVLLRVPAGDLYPSEKIAGAILARLPESARLGEWRLSATYLARCWHRMFSRA